MILVNHECFFVVLLLYMVLSMFCNADKLIALLSVANFIPASKIQILIKLDKNDFVNRLQDFVNYSLQLVVKLIVFVSKRNLHRLLCYEVKCLLESGWKAVSLLRYVVNWGFFVLKRVKTLFSSPCSSQWIVCLLCCDSVVFKGDFFDAAWKNLYCVALGQNLKVRRFVVPNECVTKIDELLWIFFDFKPQWNELYCLFELFLDLFLCFEPASIDTSHVVTHFALVVSKWGSE